MILLKGKGVSPGYALGQIHFINSPLVNISKKSVSDTDAEIHRFRAALDKAVAETDKLYSDALTQVGPDEAEIFNIHKMMLEDSDYREYIENIIKTQGVCCEYAVSLAKQSFADMFSSMEDTYMRERAKDVSDVSDRLIAILTGKNEDPKEISGIVAAEDLVPSQTIALDKSKVFAFITSQGSQSSHTAILARGMNIPAVAAIKNASLSDYNGHFAAVDGFSGEVYIDPDEKIVSDIKRKIEKEQDCLTELEDFIGQETVTQDGTKINLFANIGGLSDIDYVLKNDGEGVGLFRSEFIFLNRSFAPTENEQFEIYKAAAEKMEGKKLIIRTLDIGADKNAPYLNPEHEENPAMGLRAIRFCLLHQDIFKTQLRAILHASAFGKVSVMFPMIISPKEIISAKEILKEAMAELKAENIPFDDNIEIGIMIETPAAAIVSDILANEVDFFSIGTNDLIQYTLAVDRQNTAVSDLCQENLAPVLKLIAITAENGQKNGIWVGVCGELASDLSLTEFFIKSGISELSVSPSNILKVRKKIREL